MKVRGEGKPAFRLEPLQCSGKSVRDSIRGIAVAAHVNQQSRRPPICQGFAGLREFLRDTVDAGVSYLEAVLRIQHCHRGIDSERSFQLAGQSKYMVAYPATRRGEPGNNVDKQRILDGIHESAISGDLISRFVDDLECAPLEHGIGRSLAKRSCQAVGSIARDDALQVPPGGSLLEG
jgi:hypothetical protein